ncbi:hypothetical protein ACC691_37835, partial [Rhizobium johnstonii]|uniref:hypothetical protein n=1 Tax=Rhizobium johnstonii TaxID=3019933 RepID=UPI003F9A6E89
QKRAIRRFTAMTVIVLIALAALTLWAVLATVLGIENDGYGRPEIRDRNRHVEHTVTWDVR